jgi:hypothetical protein
MPAFAGMTLLLYSCRINTEHFQQQGLFLPFICTPDELLGDDND